MERKHSGNRSTGICIAAVYDIFSHTQQYYLGGAYCPYLGPVALVCIPNGVHCRLLKGYLQLLDQYLAIATRPVVSKSVHS